MIMYSTDTHERHATCAPEQSELGETGGRRGGSGAGRGEEREKRASERKREGVVHLLGSRRTRMRVCTHSGAFERLSRDMHARTHARRDARVCVRAFRGARMASRRWKDGRRERG